MHLHTMSEGWVGLGKRLRLLIIISPITMGTDAESDYI